MKQLTNGVYQLTRGANMYLIETAPDELTLIDTGIPGARRLVLDAIEELGKMPQHLKQILITHADFDHAGSLAGIAEATGATVYASKEAKPYIEAAESPPHIAPPISWITGGIQRLVQKAAHVDVTVENGELLAITAGGMEALSLPGHTPDHYGFYWREHSIMFAADLFFPSNNGLQLTPAPLSWDMEAAHRSARKVLDFKPSMICIGHGSAVNLTQNPDAVKALEATLARSSSLAAI